MQLKNLVSITYFKLLKTDNALIMVNYTYSSHNLTTFLVGIFPTNFYL